MRYQDEINTNTLFRVYKTNANDHGGLEISEFEELVFAAIQIFACMEDQPRLTDETLAQKLRHQTEEQYSETQEKAKEQAIKLALEFDKNGDGVFCLKEFTSFAEKYLKEEYIKRLIQA